MIKILEYLNEHYSASSTKGYENMINKYRAYMQSKAQRANYHDIMGYVSYLRKSNLHPKSLRNHLFAIKIYYRYLVEMEVRKDHPCEKLYLRDQPKHRDREFIHYRTIRKLIKRTSIQ